MNISCHYHLCLGTDPPLFLGKFAVELAGILGFHSLALDFPVLSSKPSEVQGDFNVIIRQGSLSANREAHQLTLSVNNAQEAEDLLQDIASDLNTYFPTSQRARVETPPKNFVFASEKPMPVDSPPPAPIGIENFLLPGAWLRDLDGDFLPDLVDTGIEIAEDAVLDTFAAAANIAAVLAAQTTVYSFPLITSDRTGLIHFRASQNPASVRVDGQTIRFEGQNLSEFTSRLMFLVLPGQMGSTPSNWLDKSGRPRATLPLCNWLAHLRDDLAMRQTDGQFAWAIAHGAVTEDETMCFFNPDAQQWNRRNRLLKEKQVRSHKDDQLVWEMKRSFVWEVERFRKIIKKAVLPGVRSGSNVTIRAALSEDEEVRTALASEVCRWIEERGAQAEIQLICAYKQGYSWIDEQLIPRLRQLEGLDHLKIFFKAYLPEGMSEFREENGAVPKISSERADNPNHWFDLPIRPLQELYPISDTLSAALNLDHSKIEFAYYTGEDELTYLVQAQDAHGCELLSERLQTVWAERPYLDRYPDIGKVHPPTGYLKASIDGVAVCDELIPTDLELVWDAYQSEVLPAATEHILNATNGAITAAMQPFFSRLEIRLDLSEPDSDLPSRTDRLSSLDALHEDLYFVGLDHFRTLGQREAGEVINSPGLILPIIRKRTGRPRLHARLTERCAPNPQIRRNQSVVAQAISPSELRLSITGAAQEPDGLSLFLSIEGPESLDNVIRAYGTLTAKARLKNCLNGLGIATVRGTLNQNPFPTWHITPTRKRNFRGRAIAPADFHVPQTEVIGYRQYLKLISQVQRIPGFRVYPIAESYQGRMIHAIEVSPDSRGWLPRVKWICSQPTVYINARHHANEVSGTNTNFNLVSAFASSPELKKLLGTLNVVMVPLENADGTAIHYALMQDNPRWKLHVARFNALGTELALEYFKDDTFQTEALAYTRVWREWLPDVVVDDHGVPTHEWDQPFSGYTSPWFKGFWLPRALLYGYFFHINEPGYESNLTVNKAVEHAVAESLKMDERIIALNREWRDRFFTYANKWLPSLFPANYYQDIITYWIPSPYKPVHNYASVRFPWVTAVSFVAEVSDETAQGDYLELCALAHFNQDVAILKMLADSTVSLKQTVSREARGGQLTWQRKRPLICNSEGETANLVQGGGTN